MSNKNTAISLLGASLILGGAVFLASLVNNGLILQKEKAQPKENIVTTTVGHVNLGKVYSESQGMDITLVSSNDKAPAAIKLTDVDPNDFSKEVHSALTKISDDINESQKLTGDKAMKPEQLSGKVPFKLNIKTYMNYRSQYMPFYTLMIKDEDITINKDETLESRVIAEAQRIAKESSPAFSANSFIKSVN